MKITDEDVCNREFCTTQTYVIQVCLNRNDDFA